MACHERTKPLKEMKWDASKIFQIDETAWQESDTYHTHNHVLRKILISTELNEYCQHRIGCISATLHIWSIETTMIGVNPVGLSNHRGLYLYLDKSDAVFKKGEILTGTASLDLQDSLEIIGECYYSDEF